MSLAVARPEAPGLVAVTGAARGIGFATARLLGSRGVPVFLLDRDEPAGQDAAAGIVANGGDARFIPCDVTDEAAITAAFDECARMSAPLVGLVCNAGTNAYLDPLRASTAEWDAIFALNVRSAWLCARAAVPLMGDGGSIVNIASIHASRTVTGLFPYAATKSALLGLTRGLALELGPSGIRVNVVCPGWTRTGLTASALERGPDAAGRLAAVERLHPLGRIGDADEIAGAVAYLLSSDATFVTGAEIHADGGLGALSPA